jgi:hypothetical protein
VKYDDMLRLFHVRNRIAGGQTWYNIHGRNLVGVWNSACDLVGEKNLYISAMAPTEQTLFQGEVQRSERYVDLQYATLAKPMRDALRERGKSVGGIIAVSLLRYYLCPQSYDWLQYLFDAYPDHIVEFSTYSVEWGTVPGHNTVFWEIRQY